MTADDSDIPPKSVFYRQLDENGIEEWYLELAGDDPGRRAAVTRWLTSDDVGPVANIIENRFTTLCCEDADVKPEDLLPLIDFPEIDWLRFKRAKLSAGAVDAIKHLRYLKGIESEDTILDNRFCRSVSQLPKLENLSLSNSSEIDDAGAEHLSRLENLKGLNLHGSKITSQGLKHLAKLTNLTQLQVANTLVDDAGLRHVATLKRLIWLECDNTCVTDAGVEHLRDLNLGVLTLGDTAVTDRSAAVIAKMDRMTKVHLQNTRISNEAIRLLAPLPKLGDELNVQNTAIDDGCVPYVKQMTKLNRLDLRGTKISKAGLQRIRTALKPNAALYNDHGVPLIDHASAKSQSGN